MSKQMVDVVFVGQGKFHLGDGEILTKGDEAEITKSQLAAFDDQFTTLEAHEASQTSDDDDDDGDSAED